MIRLHKIQWSLWSSDLSSSSSTSTNHQSQFCYRYGQVVLPSGEAVTPVTSRHVLFRVIFCPLLSHCVTILSNYLDQHCVSVTYLLSNSIQGNKGENHAVCSSKIGRVQDLFVIKSLAQIVTIVSMYHVY